MNFMLSYDLNKSGKNYDGLIDKIKSISTTWCTPCRSTWLISCAFTTSEALYAQLHPLMDSDDYIVIAAITKDVYGYMDKEVAEHITTYFR